MVRIDQFNIDLERIKLIKFEIDWDYSKMI